MSSSLFNCVNSVFELLGLFFVVNETFLYIMKSNGWFVKLASVIGLLLVTTTNLAQRRIEFSAGCGVPEYTNIRIKYGDNIQFGICGHYFYEKPSGSFGPYHSWVLTAESVYHFAGRSHLVSQPTWYLLGGIGYFHNDLIVDIPHEEFDVGFYPRIGRTFNFSNRMGINADMGLYLPLSARDGYKPYRFRLLPSGGISLFVRL
jgi:hypothetical protein